jgi:hypothetical protein
MGICPDAGTSRGPASPAKLAVGAGRAGLTPLNGDTDKQANAISGIPVQRRVLQAAIRVGLGRSHRGKDFGELRGSRAG